MTDDKKRKNREAGLKASATKGPEERKRAAHMAAWTRKHGKNDKANPYSAENYYGRTDAHTSSNQVQLQSSATQTIIEEPG